MKTSYSPLIIFLLLILVSSCEKEDKDPFAGKSDYFTCKIDGVPFEPKGMHTCYGLRVNFYPRGTAQLNPGYFTVGASDCQSQDYESVGFNIFVLNPSQKVYQVPHDSVRAYYGSNFLMDSIGSTTIDSSTAGEIRFTTLIPQEYDADGKRTETAKVEGTFHYTLISPDGEKIEITDGRFGFFKIQ